MKKFLLFISFIGFAGCNTYTVTTDEDIKAGSKEVQAGQCVEFSDNFFGLFGDYPITFTKADGSELENGKDKPAGHYKVAGGKVEESDTACKVKPSKKEGDTTASDTTVTDDGESDEVDEPGGPGTDDAQKTDTQQDDDKKVSP